MRRRAPLLLVGLLLPLLSTAATSPRAAADEPLERTGAIRKILVPERDPESWPQGDWEPILWSDLERLLTAARESPLRQATVLERADYQATLAGDQLRQGAFEWTLPASLEAPGFHTLQPWNLVPGGLTWLSPDGASAALPALWGTSPEQVVGLWIDQPARRLVGQWSLVGRKLARSAEFLVEVPPAAVSRFVLQAPQGLALTVSAGDLSPPRAANDEGWLIWELHLGGRTSCRLRFEPTTLEAAARPLVLARSRLNCVVRPEVVRIQAEYDLEVTERPLTELALSLPEGLQVTAVGYGDQEEVEWRLQEDPDTRLTIRLPDAVLGAAQVLRIRGVAPISPLEPWQVPRLNPREVLETDAQVTVRLQRPYQAADVRLDGYRQVELTALPGEGETLVLRRLRPGGSVTIIPARRRGELSCRSVTLADVSSREWTLTSQVILNSTAGEAFDADCLIPAGWDVVDVRGQGPAGGEDPIGWEARTGDAGQQVLRLSFVVALSPDRPRTVRILARRAEGSLTEGSPLPLVSCAGAVELDAAAVLLPGSGLRCDVSPAPGVRLASLAELPEEMQQVEFLRDSSVEFRQRATVIRAEEPNAAGAWRLLPLHSPAVPNSGRAETPGRAPQGTPAAAAVTADVRLGGASGDSDRFHVTVTILGGAGRAWSWTMPSGIAAESVRLNGEVVEPASDGPRRTLTLPDVGRHGPPANLLEVNYGRPVQPGFGPVDRRLEFPMPESPVLSFQLQLRAPHAVRLTGDPTGLELSEEGRSSAAWLGIAARPSGEAPFYPLRADDWRRLWTELTGVPAQPADSPEGLRSAPGTESDRPVPLSPDEGWRTWTGHALSVPDAVEFSTWDAARADAVSWLATGLLLLGAAGLRIRPVVSPRLMGAAAAALLTAGVCCLPALYAEWAGSAWAGLALGALLPDRILQFSRDQFPLAAPSGSTRSFVPVVLLAMWTGGTCVLGGGAEPDERDPGGDRRPVGRPLHERFDVLVPVDGAGRPASADGLCYVSSRVLDRLEQAVRDKSPPPCLIRQAEYSARAMDSQRLLVTARFDITLLTDQSDVRVRLPVRPAIPFGDHPCLVDGRPHPLLADAEAEGWIVELRGTTERPPAVPVPTSPPGTLPESDLSPRASDASGTVPRRPLRTHQIELRLVLAGELQTGELSHARLAVPPVGRTLVRMAPSGAAPGFRALMGTAGSQPTARSAATDAVELLLHPGAASQLDFEWSGNTAVASRLAELQVSLSALVDLTPTVARTQCQFQYRMLGGRVNALAWDLPPECSVVAVQSPGLSGYLLEDAPEGRRRLIAEFLEPRSEPFQVNVIVAQPLDFRSPTTDLALVLPAEAPGQPAHLTLARARLAIRHPADFRLSVSPAAADQVIRSLDVEAFLEDFVAAGVRPHLALELVRASVVRLIWEELPALLSAKTELRGHFTRDHLDCVFLAEIEQPSVPPFRYRLRADPRLRLRRISVQEDGAERLLRWSQADNEVVLFLADRAARPQTLRVEGRLGLAPGSPIDLPRLELLGAAAAPGRLTLSADPDVSVALQGLAGFISSPAAASGAEGRPRTIYRGEWPADAPVQFELAVAPDRIQGSAAIDVQGTGPSLRLTVAAEYRVRSGSVRRLALDLPAALAESAIVHCEPFAQVVRESDVPGDSRLVFYPAEPITDSFRALIESVAPSPAGHEWRVPAVRLTGTVLQTSWLSIPEEMSVPLATGETPDWLDSPLFATSRLAEKAWRPLPDGDPTISIQSRHAAERPTAAPLAEVDLCLAANGARAGRLLVWLPEDCPSTLEFEWPAAARPAAAVVDGTPVSLEESSAGGWSLPLRNEAGTTPRLVWLSWSESGGPVPSALGKLRWLFPWPRNMGVSALIQHEYIAHRWRPWLADRPDALQDQEIALLRATALVDAVEREPAPGSDGPWSLRGWAGDAVVELDRWEHSDGRWPAGWEARAASVRRRAAALSKPDLTTDNNRTPLPIPLWAPCPDHGPALRQAAVWQSEDGSGAADIPAASLALWVVHPPLWSVVLGGMVGLLAGFAAWRTAGLWSWIQARERAAWVSLGVFWWLALTPSWLGLLFAATGGLLRRTRPVGREDAAAAAEPGQS